MVKTEKTLTAGRLNAETYTVSTAAQARAKELRVMNYHVDWYFSDTLRCYVVVWKDKDN